MPAPATTVRYSTRTLHLGWLNCRSGLSSIAEAGPVSVAMLMLRLPLVSAIENSTSESALHD